MSIPNALKCGEGVDNGCSITGFGQYNNQPALITCGHTNYLGKVINYNGNRIGEVVYQRIGNSYYALGDYYYSDGDFAIVQLDNNYTSQNLQLYMGTSWEVANGGCEAPVGTIVKYYGNSTKYHTGIISAINQVCVYQFVEGFDKEVRVYGVSTISGTVTNVGDSGGAVYLKTAAGRNCIAGTIIASNSSSSTVKFTTRNWYEDYGFTFDTSY